MEADTILNIGTEALKTTAMVASPMLAGALLIGLIVSVFQAITQINEATLTFIPKMVVIGIIIVIAGPWMLDVLSVYTINIFENLPDIVRH